MNFLAASASSSIPFVLVALMGILCIAYLVLWIWSLIHCIQNKSLSDNNRIIGVVLIVVLGIVGSLVYLFIPREDGVQKVNANYN